jgi:hypothetical protein
MAEESMATVWPAMVTRLAYHPSPLAVPCGTPYEVGGYGATH